MRLLGDMHRDLHQILVHHPVPDIIDQIFLFIKCNCQPGLGPEAAVLLSSTAPSQPPLTRSVLLSCFLAGSSEFLPQRSDCDQPWRTAARYSDQLAATDGGQRANHRWPPEKPTVLIYQNCLLLFFLSLLRLYCVKKWHAHPPQLEQDTI